MESKKVLHTMIILDPIAIILCCYHPLFCFNQYGDCEGAMLRPGNDHSADRWKELLEPIVRRYEGKKVRKYFRGDAAFASYDSVDDAINNFQKSLSDNESLVNK
jgi:hypothetical protein